MSRRADAPGEGLGVGGESGCVPAVVTGELTLQVAGWLCEGSQELHRPQQWCLSAICDVPVKSPFTGLPISLRIRSQILSAPKLHQSVLSALT